MKQSFADLDYVLENGLSDLDANDPYQIAAKVNLHFLECPCCGKEENLLNYDLPIEISSWLEASLVIRQLGWGFINPRDGNLIETNPMCPNCLWRCGNQQLVGSENRITPGDQVGDQISK